MPATIGDPYTLSSYSLPSKSSKKGKEKADGTPFVFASHFGAGKKRDGLVSVAAQGDGVHVLDLLDLHPVSSHILGPSTSFASPAVTLVYNENEKRIRSTFVAIQSAPDVSSQDERKTIWSWKEDAATEIGSSPERISHVLPHTISFIAAYGETSPRLLFVSETGQVTQTDSSFTTLNTWACPDSGVKLAKLLVFPRKDCTFIPTGSRLPMNGIVLILFLTSRAGLQLQTIVFGNDHEMAVLDSEDINEKSGDVLDISCTASGYVTLLYSDGRWSAYRIGITNNQTKLSSIASPLRLQNLRFITDKRAESVPQRQQVSMLGLNSSYVLFAGITKADNAEIALLLWDIQYGVLLHSHTLPIPSTLGSESLSFSVELLQGSPSQSFLVLSPAASKSKNPQLRTTVSVIPFSIPETSRLSDALGRAKAGARWIVSEGSPSAPSAIDSTKGAIDIPGPTQDDLAKSQNELLQKIQDLVEEEKPEDADNLFLGWVKANSETAEKRVKKEKKKKKKTKRPAGVNESSDESAEDPEVPVKGNDTTIDNKSKPDILGRRTLFNHSFVLRLLEIVMHPKNSSAPYSPKIFRFLLQRNLVSNSMIAGGILPILLERNDWDSIRECFHKMIDLSETDVLRTLHAVVKYHQKRANDSNAMAVDGPNPAQVSTLPSFLAVVIDYPASPVGWRKAIRQYLSDVDDLMSVLTVIDDWVTAWVEKDTDLELGEVKLNEYGTPVPVPKTRKPIRLRGTTMPSMENTVLFLQAILDSSFLALLQHPPSHALLHRLSGNFAPQISFNTGLEPLVGPLAPFARAQAKNIADAKGGQKKEEVDWRKRRKQLLEQNAINLGPYQVEEIIF